MAVREHVFSAYQFDPEVFDAGFAVGLAELDRRKPRWGRCNNSDWRRVRMPRGETGPTS